MIFYNSLASKKDALWERWALKETVALIGVTWMLMSGMLGSPVFGQNSTPDPAANVEDTSITQSDQLWYFGIDASGNHIKPAQYNYKVTLTDTADTKGTFTWTVINGADKVDLYDGTSLVSTVTIKGSNTVVLVSKAASAAAASVTNDVVIQIKVDGNIQGVWNTVVFAPNALQNLRNVDNASGGGNGYSSLIHYAIKDQFNQTLPRDVEINEDWEATVNDIAGNDWQNRNGNSVNAEGSATIAPNDWADNMTRAGLVHPLSLPPQSPLLGTLVNHWNGQWRVGSLVTRDGPNNNDGRAVKSLTWHMYQDHGRN